MPRGSGNPSGCCPCSGGGGGQPGTDPQIETNSFFLICEAADPSIRYLAFGVFDENTGTTTIQYLNFDGTPATPTAPVDCGDLGYELISQCFIATANGVGYSLGDYLTHIIVYRTPGFTIEAEIWRNVTAATIIAAPPNTDVSPCQEAYDVEVKLLCDYSGSNESIVAHFNRIYVYDTFGNIISATNVQLDGTTPYAPLGTVRHCEFRDSELTILCDVNPITNDVLAQYVRHWVLSESGQVQSFTYRLDGTNYVPVGEPRICNDGAVALPLCVYENQSIAPPNFTLTPIAQTGYNFPNAISVNFATAIPFPDSIYTEVIWDFGYGIHVFTDQGNFEVNIAGRPVPFNEPVRSRVITRTRFGFEVQYEFFWRWLGPILGIVIDPIPVYPSYPYQRQVATIYGLYDSAGTLIGYRNYDGTPHTPIGPVLPCGAEGLFRPQATEPLSQTTELLDTEVVRLCDYRTDGSIVPFLRTFVFERNGLVLYFWNIQLNPPFTAGPVQLPYNNNINYNPDPGGTVRICEDQRDMQLFCDLAPDGTVIQRYWRVYILDSGTPMQFFNINFDGTPYLPIGVQQTICPQTCNDTEHQIFCDFAPDDSIIERFIRTFTYDCDGELVQIRNHRFDGTPYFPIGVRQGICTTDAWDVETQLLCDFAPDGTVIERFIRTFLYDETGVVTGLQNHRLDGTPYFPVGVQQGVCTTENWDVEHQLLCDFAPDGSIIERFIRSFVYDEDGNVTNLQNHRLDGAPYFPVGVEQRPCTQESVEVETQLLCDLDPAGIIIERFVRSFVYDEDGNVANLQNHRLDGAPYFPVGVEQVPCGEAGNDFFQELCDFTIGPNGEYVNNRFFRFYNVDEDGNIINFVDLDEEGLTYLPNGDVRFCGTRDTEIQILCDVQPDGTRIPFLRYNVHGDNGDVFVFQNIDLNSGLQYNPTGVEIGLCELLDVEVDELCDFDFNGIIQQTILRVKVFEAGNLVNVILLDALNLTPTNILGQAFPCNDVHHERTPICEFDNDNNLIQELFVIHSSYQGTTFAFRYQLPDGTPYNPTGNLFNCEIDVEIRKLCDFDTGTNSLVSEFIRAYRYRSGTLIGFSDFEIDGTTPYTLTGDEIRECADGAGQQKHELCLFAQVDQPAPSIALGTLGTSLLVVTASIAIAPEEGGIIRGYWDFGNGIHYLAEDPNQNFTIDLTQHNPPIGVHRGKLIVTVNSGASFEYEFFWEWNGVTIANLNVPIYNPIQYIIPVSNVLATYDENGVLDGLWLYDGTDIFPPPGGAIIQPCDGLNPFKPWDIEQLSSRPNNKDVEIRDACYAYTDVIPHEIVKFDLVLRFGTSGQVIETYRRIKGSQTLHDFDEFFPDPGRPGQYVQCPEPDITGCSCELAPGTVTGPFNGNIVIDDNLGNISITYNGLPAEIATLQAAFTDCFNNDGFIGIPVEQAVWGTPILWIPYDAIVTTGPGFINWTYVATGPFVNWPADWGTSCIALANSQTGASTRLIQAYVLENGPFDEIGDFSLICFSVDERRALLVELCNNPKVTHQILCDEDGTPFVRFYDFDADRQLPGNVVFFDYDLDGNGFIPVGAVGACAGEEGLVEREILDFSVNAPGNNDGVDSGPINFPYTQTVRGVPVITEPNVRLNVNQGAFWGTYTRGKGFDVYNGDPAQPQWEPSGNLSVNSRVILPHSMVMGVEERIRTVSEVLCDSADGTQFIRIYHYTFINNAFLESFDIDFLGAPYTPIGAPQRCPEIYGIATTDYELLPQTGTLNAQTDNTSITVGPGLFPRYIHFDLYDNTGAGAKIKALVRLTMSDTTTQDFYVDTLGKGWFALQFEWYDPYITNVYIEYLSATTNQLGYDFLLKEGYNRAGG